MKLSAPRARAAACALAVLSVLVAHPRFVVAQEGSPSPPPADSTVTEEPRSTEPEQPAPAPKTEARPSGGRGIATAWRDSIGLVLPLVADVRNKTDLTQDGDLSRTLQAQAQDRMLKARERSLRWKSQAEQQKTTLDQIGKEIGVAKKEKREADKKSLEAEKKREEQVRDYFSAMERALTAEGDFHQAAIDYALARLAVVDVELKLSETWNANGYAGRLEPQTRDLEKRLLLAIKERDEKMSTYAQREKSLTDRRIEALTKWPGPDVEE